MKFKPQLVARTLFKPQLWSTKFFLIIFFTSAIHASEASATNIPANALTDTKSDLLRNNDPSSNNPVVADRTSNNSLTETTGNKRSRIIYKPVDIVINGSVFDDTGLPVPGATIREKGTQNATSTDSKGFFTIKLKSTGSVLTITSIGYISQDITVGNEKSVKIILKSDRKSLQDVVVVGYSTQKKINVTGAISSIGTKELVQSPAANISNSLVGRLPGLFASQSNGEPGNDASTLRIRGSGTYSGNTNPLILVDGIEVTNYNNIDPNEIESLTLLKDASSTAVYGIRGANGVIIITTKRGKNGPAKVSYSYNQAFNSFTSLVNDMNSADFARSSNEGQLLDSYVTGAPYTPRYSDADIALYESGADPIFHPNVNWPKLMFRNYSSQSQHNLNVSGGQNGVQYFISGGLFSQDGLFRDTKDIIQEFSANSTYKRYNFRSNFNFDATKRLKIRFDLSSQFENRSGNNIGDQSNGFVTGRLVSDILKTSPLDGPGYLDGKIVNITNATVNNPFTSLLSSPAGGGLRREYDNYLIGTLRLDHDLDFITKGLKVHGDVAYNTTYSSTFINQKSVTIYVVSKLPDGTLNFQPNAFTSTPNFAFTQPAGAGNNSTRRVTAEMGFDYNRTFSGDHNVTALLLYNQQKTYNVLFVPAIPMGYQSLVGRVTYAYKNRYLAEFDAGYNGSENFAPGRRFGFFPAYSAGWVASEEKFFPKNDLISFLKFRGSYGEVGNDVIGGSRFLYNATSYSTRSGIYYLGNYVGNYTAYNGLVEGAAGNSDVTWERAKKTDIGIEMYLINQKVKLTADYFNEDRSNILTTPNTISQVAGLIQPAVNIGSMNNRGFDGEISFSDSFGSLKYRVGANYSYAHNKVLFRDEVANTYSYQNRTGQRLGQYFALPTNGLFNTWAEVNDINRPVYPGNNKVQPGDIRYVDTNGDGKIDQFDAVPVGYSNIPEKTYGISLSGSYKNFDFSVLFQGASNVSLSYTSLQRTTSFSSTPPLAVADYLIESWTPERYAQGLPISFPRLSYTSTNNPNSGFGNLPDIYIADASYIRMKNVELGYTVDGKFLQKIGLKSARIYANANNLYTWSKVYKGIDPENLPQNGSSDTNQQSYPLVRTINLGINVNF